MTATLPQFRAWARAEAAAAVATAQRIACVEVARLMRRAAARGGATMSDKYILNDAGEPVPEPDLYVWGEWFERSLSQRRVGNDTVGDCRVSTVFLGLDHNWGSGPSLLWETMVFGGPMDQEQERCGGSRKKAEAMHAAMLQRVIEDHPKP